MNWKNFLTQLKIANHFSDAELRASRITARGEPISSSLYIIFLLCLATFLGAILSLIVTSINLNDITSADEIAGVMVLGKDPSELGINVTSLHFINVGTLVASLATMVELHFMVKSITKSHLSILVTMLQVGMIPLYLVMFVITIVIGMVLYPVFASTAVIQPIMALVAIAGLFQAIIWIIYRYRD